MVTTNLPQLVTALSMLTTVHVHDTQERIELTISDPEHIQDVDDLMCDALFVDPVSRKQDHDQWIIRMDKRAALRGASDLDLKSKAGTTWYAVRPTA